MVIMSNLSLGPFWRDKKGLIITESGLRNFVESDLVVELSTGEIRQIFQFLDKRWQRKYKHRGATRILKSIDA